MARNEITVELRVKWWLKYAVYALVAIAWLRGCDDVNETAINWLVRHGVSVQ